MKGEKLKLFLYHSHHQTPWFPRGLHAHTHIHLSSIIDRPIHVVASPYYNACHEAAKSCHSHLGCFIFADGEV